MSLIQKTRLWLRAKLDPDDVELAIDEELRYHIDMRAGQYEAEGLDKREARRAAEKRFGSVSSVRRECARLSMLTPSRQGGSTMHSLMRDMRFALRTLTKSKGFSAVVLVTLALGVGANTAIFSIIEGVLLRPFPYDDPDRLVMLWQNDRLRGTTREGFSAPDFFDVRERSSVFDGLAFFQTPPYTLTADEGEPMNVNTALVSAGLYEVLGTAPLVGRTFYADEHEPGGEAVTILSHRLWMSRFGGDRSVVGALIRLEGESREVVGIMGPEFRFPSSADLWVPSQVTATSRPRGNHGFAVVARLAAGANLDEANANLEAIAGALEAEYPDDNQGRGMWAQPLFDASVGSVETPLLVLLGAVGLVLLVGSVNVANLMFARSLSRQQEIAIRSAMGAGRLALLRQSLSESLLLSLAGGALGVAVAYLGLGALLAMVPSNLPRVANVSLNPTVLAFSLGLSILTGVLFGLAPAVLTWRRNLVSSLRDGARTGASSSKRFVRHVLVTAEIALAVVLVVGAGLLMTSFWKLMQVDPGFTPARLASVTIGLPASRYPQSFNDWPNLPEVRQFQNELLERARQTPGFELAALAQQGPLDAGWTSRFTIEGRPEVPDGEQDEVRVRTVSSDYFRLAGIPILRGRPLEASDDRVGAAPVLLINESFARRYFVDEEPVGARISQWGRTHEIVGIVRDVKFQGLDTDTAPAIYPVMENYPFAAFQLLVRSRERTETTFAKMRELVWSIDRDLALSRMTTLEERLDASVSRPRFTTALFGAFAVVALALAALGIYGVMSYSVRERAHEIGIRMSLGAGRRSVLALIMSDGARLAGIGVGVGLVVAALLSRTLETLLFGVGRFDPLTFASVSSLAAIVALAACYVPAMRATRVDPITTLRHD